MSSAFRPTAKGVLALLVLVANALIVPLLVPAYDGPGFGVGQGVVAVGLAALTAVVCFRWFYKGRVADRMAGTVSLMFAAWIFYVLVRRIL